MNKASQRPSLTLLPVALVLIVAATGVPIELRTASWEYGAPNAGDFVNNVVLYLPFGIALWRRPVLIVMLAAALLSASMELLQVWSFGRSPSAFDLVANTAGCGFGVALARWHAARKAEARPHGIALNAFTAGTALVVAVGLLLVWAFPVASSDLSNWNRDYDLLLGNETTGDRPWRGVISTLAITPAALSAIETDHPGDLGDLGDLGNGKSREELRNHHAYILTEPLNLAGGEAHRLPSEFSSRFVDKAVEQNAFTVILNAATADEELKGPARMVSQSLDQFNRNFDVGQEGRAVSFRVRTPATGENGNDYHASTGNVLEAHREVTIVAAFDGVVSRIYVDGKLKGRANLAAAGCAVAALCDLDLPLALVLLGGSFSVLALAVSRYHGKQWTLVVSLAAGIAAASILAVTNRSAALQAYGAGTLFFIVAGSLTVGLAAAFAGSRSYRA